MGQHELAQGAGGGTQRVAAGAALCGGADRVGCLGQNQAAMRRFREGALAAAMVTAPPAMECPTRTAGPPRRQAPQRSPPAQTGGPGTQLADLELRHRRRGRCEDRIRVAKDTGLTNLPLHGFDQNRIWCALVALAVELTAWMQILSLAGHHARRWEPKRLRHRLFNIPAALARPSRRVWLHICARAPWADLVYQAITRLMALAQPG